MRKPFLRCLVTIFLAICLSLMAWSIRAAEKVGLLIIAHGAPQEDWNTLVRELGKTVAQKLQEQSSFAGVKISFLEFARPSISESVRLFEREGFNRLIVVPLFIAPSDHTVKDLPAVLGLYLDPEVAKTLKAEGAEIVNSPLRMTITGTLCGSDFLQESMLQRVKELSTNPDSEAVILLAHGSHDYSPMWKDLCRQIGNFICGKTGITYFDFAFIEIGQTFVKNAIPAIVKASQKRKTVLLIGLYLSMGIDKILAKYRDQKNLAGESLIKDIKIKASTRGILPDEKVVDWIIYTAVEVLKPN